MKICNSCGVEKEVGLFSKGRGNCKGCRAAKQREYNIANKEKQREYRIANKEVIAARERAYVSGKRKNDPLFKFTGQVRVAIRDGIIRKGYRKTTRTHKILGCDYQFFMEYIKMQFTEGMTIDQLGSDIHLDHIIPVSSATTHDEVLRLNHYSNFQPLWAADNTAKSNSMPEQWQIDRVKEIYELAMSKHMR